ncbi:Cell death-inducing p53-target protein 1, partial [Clarias magur]
MLHSERRGLPRSAEPDESSWREAVPFLERNFPTSVQHAEISERRRRPGSSQLLQ